MTNPEQVQGAVFVGGGHPEEHQPTEPEVQRHPTGALPPRPGLVPATTVWATEGYDTTKPPDAIYLTRRQVEREPKASEPEAARPRWSLTPETSTHRRGVSCLDEDHPGFFHTFYLASADAILLFGFLTAYEALPKASEPAPRWRDLEDLVVMAGISVVGGENATEDRPYALVYLAEEDLQKVLSERHDLEQANAELQRQVTLLEVAGKHEFELRGAAEAAVAAAKKAMGLDGLAAMELLAQLGETQESLSETEAQVTALEAERDRLELDLAATMTTSLKAKAEVARLRAALEEIRILWQSMAPAENVVERGGRIAALALEDKTNHAPKV